MAKESSMKCKYCGNEGCTMCGKMMAVMPLLFAVLLALQAMNFITIPTLEWIIAIVLGLQGLLMLKKVM